MYKNKYYSLTLTHLAYVYAASAEDDGRLRVGAERRAGKKRVRRES